MPNGPDSRLRRGEGCSGARPARAGAKSLGRGGRV